MESGGPGIALCRRQAVGFLSPDESGPGLTYETGSSGTGRELWRLEVRGPL